MFFEKKLKNKKKYLTYILEKSNLEVCIWNSSLTEWVTKLKFSVSKKKITSIFKKFTTESLILAQDERWRRA